MLYVLEHVMDYYPYGKILREYVLERERFQTTHHERDVETGLDYRGARFYDSDLGRFLSADPHAANYYGWSPYSYTFNNPIRFIDPDGRDPIEVFLKALSFSGTVYEWGGKNPNQNAIAIEGGLGARGRDIVSNLSVALRNVYPQGTREAHRNLNLGSCSLGVDCSGLASSSFNADSDKLMADLPVGTANDQMKAFQQGEADGTGSLNQDFNDVITGDLVFKLNKKGRATHVMVATGNVTKDKNGNVNSFEVIHAPGTGNFVRADWRKVKNNQRLGKTKRGNEVSNISILSNLPFFSIIQGSRQKADKQEELRMYQYDVNQN